jgi:hypothetical protein
VGGSAPKPPAPLDNPPVEIRERASGRTHEEVAWELEKIENPHKYSAANVPHESLDDLDRQTE